MFMLFEDIHQKNVQVFLMWVSHYFHFRAVYCSITSHDSIFISLQEHCNRNYWSNDRL